MLGGVVSDVDGLDCMRVSLAKTGHAASVRRILEKTSGEIFNLITVKVLESFGLQVMMGGKIFLQLKSVCACQLLRGTAPTRQNPEPD